MNHRGPLGLAFVALFTLVIPAAAFARPQSTSGVEVAWINQSLGLHQDGSVSIAVHELGTAAVVIDARRTTAITCPNGSPGVIRETWSGEDHNAIVSSAFGKRLTSAEIEATAMVPIETRNSCDGSQSTGRAQVVIQVSTVATARIERSRDSSMGTRTLRRSAEEVTLVIDGFTLDAGAVIFESIAKS